MAAGGEATRIARVVAEAPSLEAEIIPTMAYAGEEGGEYRIEYVPRDGGAEAWGVWGHSSSRQSGGNVGF